MRIEPRFSPRFLKWLKENGWEDEPVQRMPELYSRYRLRSKAPSSRRQWTTNKLIDFTKSKMYWSGWARQYLEKYTPIIQESREILRERGEEHLLEAAYIGYCQYKPSVKEIA